MKGSDSEFQISNLKFQIVKIAACKLFRLEVQTGGRNDWLGIEMRCAACAAVKVQNFSSREIAVTSLLVPSKSAVLNRRDSMVTQCGAAKRWLVTASSFARSRRSSASTLFSKDNLEITLNGRVSSKA